MWKIPETPMLVETMEGNRCDQLATGGGGGGKMVGTKNEQPMVRHILFNPPQSDQELKLRPATVRSLPASASPSPEDKIQAMTSSFGIDDL